MKKLLTLKPGIVFLYLISFSILISGCRSSRHQRLECSDFSGRVPGTKGISHKQIVKLTSNSSGKRYHRLKTRKNYEAGPDSRFHSDLTLKASQASGDRTILPVRSISAGKMDHQLFTDSILSSSAIEKKEDQNIASVNKTSALGLVRNKPFLSENLKAPDTRPDAGPLKKDVIPSKSSLTGKKNNLPALLSLIFGSAGLIFFIVTLILIYPVALSILLVLTYLVAAAAIVLGIIGIRRAIKLKKRHLGFAIGGTGIGLLLLITLILAALL